MRRAALGESRTLRSVLRIARLANYELSWRTCGSTWHGYAVKAWRPRIEQARRTGPTGLTGKMSTVSVEALHRTTEWCACGLACASRLTDHSIQPVTLDNWR
jgi:hypothetical protein